MARRYLRAHPESDFGRKSLTSMEQEGWRFVAFNPKGYPIFRQTFKSWFLEKFFGHKVYCFD